MTHRAAAGWPPLFFLFGQADDRALDGAPVSRFIYKDTCTTYDVNAFNPGCMYVAEGTVMTSSEIEPRPARASRHHFFSMFVTLTLVALNFGFDW